MGRGAVTAAIGWRRGAGESAAGEGRDDARVTPVIGRVRDGSDPGGAHQGVWRVTAPDCRHPRSSALGLSYARMSVCRQQAERSGLGTAYVFSDDYPSGGRWGWVSV